jgi:hypothetical protein
METPQIKSVHDFESDDYNNLLVIEKKIQDMCANNLLTPHEVEIINLIRDGYLFSDIEPILKIGRETISKIYKNVCDRIAFSLGGEFTDDGFIQEVSERNNLSPREQQKLVQFMNSNLKHKILRRPTQE